jgi:acyl-CoA thioesterase FadM
MTDETGTAISRCRMIVACVDKRTRKPMNWPAEAMALFFQES